MRPRGAIGLVALLAASAPALPALAEGPASVVRAIRTGRPIRVDGVLDEEGWRAAPPFDRFVQNFPLDEAAPSERTRVRVLYDDRNLYVGIECEDARAGELVVAMGRRDAAPYSDGVTVLVDPAGGRHGALAFVVTASGVQEDGLYYDDDLYAPEWDATWEGAASRSARGWSAELAIPLDVLRAAGAAPSWGFAVRRRIGRTSELVSSASFPAGGRGIASRLGELTGVPSLGRDSDLTVVPFAASRVVAHPGGGPDAIGDVGADLRYAQQDRFVLNGAVNPDFGQVEADQAIQNLTKFEAFFPEKRPFFLDSMELFQPVGASRSSPSPQQLFYSRRIGLGAPIFAAAKATAAASDELRVSFLDAVVAGDHGPAATATDRRFQFLPRQPLHLAPLDTLPERSPATQNFFAGVARWHPAETATFGATVASALAMERTCTNDDLELAKQDKAAPPARCTTPSGTAAALHWDLRTPDREWGVTGQVTGSQALAGRRERELADGTVLHRGDPGYGHMVKLGKRGGEGLRYEARSEYESPRLDVNATGFQRTQNQHLVGVMLEHVRSSGAGFIASRSVYLDAYSAQTTDGRALNRGRGLSAGFAAQLRSLHTIRCDGGVEGAGWDVREVGSRIAYQRPGSASMQCSFSTNPALAIAVDAGAGAAWSAPIGPLRSGWDWNANAGVTVRPHPRLESRVWVASDRALYPGRAVDTSAAPYVFGDLGSGYLSVTARQQVVFTPRLTLQAYAQLFGEFGRYGPYHAFTPIEPVERIRASDLSPAAGPGFDPSFHSSLLEVNVVLRWEYRGGSTLFAVYSRSQVEPFVQGPATVRPLALGSGPVTDSFMLKWTYRLGL